MKNSFFNFFFSVKGKITVIALLALPWMLSFIAAEPMGDINMHNVSGRLPRLGIGVDIVENAGYQLNGEGRLLFHSTGSDTDSSALEIDSNEINLNNLTSAGVANASLKVAKSGSVGYVRATGRFSNPIGANVASANNLTLATKASVNRVTGTTTINLIDTTGFEDGDIVTITFDGSVTCADSVASSGVYSTVNYSTGSNFSATANDVLTLMILRETGAARKEWWEVSRTVNVD